MPRVPEDNEGDGSGGLDVDPDRAKEPALRDQDLISDMGWDDATDLESSGRTVSGGVGKPPGTGNGTCKLIGRYAFGPFVLA